MDAKSSPPWVLIPLLVCVLVSPARLVGQEGQERGEAPPEIDQERHLNLYGSIEEIEKLLSSRDTRWKNDTLNWSFYIIGDTVTTDDAAGFLQTFCPECLDVDPLPTPVPVDPCDDRGAKGLGGNPAEVDVKSMLSFHAQGSPRNIAGALHTQEFQDLLVDPAGTRKITIHVTGSSESIPRPEEVRGWCPECELDVDPLPEPTPITDPCEGRTNAPS